MARASTKPTTSSTRATLDDDWTNLYIGGEWVDGGTRKTIVDKNPYDGSVIAEVPGATKQDVDRAFDAAVEAQRAHRDRTPQELAQPLVEAIAIIEQNAKPIASLLAIESGCAEPFGEFQVHMITLPMMREAASFPFRAFGQNIKSIIPGKENIVKRQPAGVVTVISPWNVPLHLSMRAVAPALALGNAVVLKPASDTPICGGLLLAKVFDQTSLPKGLLSVLPGSGSDIGDHVAGHPKSRVVAFTGSTEVGREVAAKAARNLARPAMELGGNNAHIVLDDADVERAVAGGIFGSFVHQGQICMRINRHLVHESIYEEYVRAFTERTRALKHGDPRDPEVVVGPVINERQKEKIMTLIQQTLDAGAKVTVGGKARGLVIEPTVLRDVTNDMPAAQNEVFGPVAPIIPFADDNEAIRLANATANGLSGSVHTRDLRRGYLIADAVETGMIHVNDQSVNDEPHIPFGGVKGSGMGRYNTEAIIDEMTELKWISFQIQPREYPL